MAGNRPGRSGHAEGFGRLAWGNLFAQSAEQIALAAAPLLAVLSLGAGLAEAAWLQTGLTLPFLLAAIPAGVLADRMSRRNLLVGAEAVRLLSLLAAILLLAAGELTWPVLAMLGFVGVCGTVVFGVAAPAMVPALVPPERRPLANARIELARTAALMAGPAVGGAMVGWIGGEAAFGLAALLSALSLVALGGIVAPGRPPAVRRRPLQEIAEGGRFVFGHRLLGPVFATQFVFGIALYLILAVFVPYAVEDLGLSATATGLVLGMFGAGMVLGALLAPRIMARLPLGRVIAIGPVSGLAGAAMIASTAWNGSPAMAGAGFFLLGAGPVLWIISTTTLRQAVTPDRLLGRASAINVLAYGARPLGAGLGALLGGPFGAEACLLAAVAIFGLQATIILVSPAVRLTAQPAPAAG